MMIKVDVLHNDKRLKPEVFDCIGEFYRVVKGIDPDLRFFYVENGNSYEAIPVNRMSKHKNGEAKVE